MIEAGNIVELTGGSFAFQATPELAGHKGRIGLVVETGSESHIVELLTGERISVLEKDLKLMSAREIFSIFQNLVEKIRRI